MTTSEYLKPAFYGALFGAALVGIVGFFWSGWMTSGSAEKMANKMAHDEVIASLVPVCLDMSQVDNERLDKMASIREASSFKRREAVMETGWATMPGSKGPNRELAQACLTALDVDRFPKRPVDER